MCVSIKGTFCFFGRARFQLTYKNSHNVADKIDSTDFLLWAFFKDQEGEKIYISYT